jgi:Fe-S cluster assembly iron-binding protein IscA
MKNEKFNILILVFTALIFGCDQKVELKKSEFKVAQDYSEFTTQMENNDTLNIGVVLSMCMWSEYDQLQFTKSNDSVFLQLMEKRVMDDEPVQFNKVVYELNNDSLNLEKMMTDFDINYQKETNLPFFVITNPKEKDTILLRTTGLGNRGFNIERYQRIMTELYPKEMAEYRKEYSTPPPPPPSVIEIKETEME